MTDENRQSIAISLLVYSIVVIAALFITITDGIISRANQTNYLMIGRQWSQWNCLDELPYTETEPLHWSQENSFTQLSGTPPHAYTIIPVNNCNHSVIFYDRELDRYFTLNFTDRYTQENDINPHPVNGAYWIEGDIEDALTTRD